MVAPRPSGATPSDRPPEQEIRGDGAAVESSDDDHGDLDPGDVVVSVVMPCLNEVDSVATCVRKAVAGLAAAGLAGEVVVVDNGSTDGSPAAAAAAGARVVFESRRGYGRAYRSGFETARGRIIVMGDSDDTYDFSELGALVRPLQAGKADYVLGSRFAGHILPGAMPWSHRYIGNPVLTGLLNLLFKLDSTDAHSGMRAFTRDGCQAMRLTSDGMELASELVLSASRARLRVLEVPITYHPRAGSSKLHSLRDGWRHLLYLLLRAPRYLFVAPGVAAGAAGALGLLAVPLAAKAAGQGWFGWLGFRTAACCALLTVLGFQTVWLGICAAAVNTRAGWHRQLGRLSPRWRHAFTLERGIAVGAVTAAAGLVVDLVTLLTGSAGRLDHVSALYPLVLGTTVVVLGAQTVLGSFFLRLVLDLAPVRVPEVDIASRRRGHGRAA
jgi:hypothetical protein